MDRRPGVPVRPLVALSLLDQTRENHVYDPKLRELGARHVGYGARPEHYPVVGWALIAAMAEIAGESWKAEYETAWSAAFDIVASAMLEGAEEAALDAAA